MHLKTFAPHRKQKHCTYSTKVPASHYAPVALNSVSMTVNSNFSSAPHLHERKCFNIFIVSLQLQPIHHTRHINRGVNGCSVWNLFFVRQFMNVLSNIKWPWPTLKVVNWAWPLMTSSHVTVCKSPYASVCFVKFVGWNRGMYGVYSQNQQRIMYINNLLFIYCVY